MKAVGLAASFITLIGAVSLASATITRAIGLRGCPQSVLTSRNEVEDFKGVLLIAQQALGDLDYDNEQTLLKHSASVDHHKESDSRSYSWVIHSAATYGDLATMRLLTDAQLTGIAMQHYAVHEYWFCFENRPLPPYCKSDPPESLSSAFRALLASLTPREVEQTSNRARRPLHNMEPMPGAFPIDTYGDLDNEHSEDMSDDPEDADDDSGHVEFQLQDTNTVASSLDMSPSVRSDVGSNQQTEEIEGPAARDNAYQHKTTRLLGTAL